MTIPTPPAAVWVHDGLRVGPSAIAGDGLFAAADLPAGTVVLRLGGQVVPTAELDRRIAAADADPAAPYVDTVALGPDAHLVLPPGTAAHCGNHSCDPTLAPAGPYELATRRAVAAGTELTVDYARLSGPGFTLACSCGAAGCRGTITGETRRFPWADDPPPSP